MSDKKLKIQAVADPLAGLPITMDIEKDSLAEQKAMTEAFAEQKAKAAKRGNFKSKEKAETDRRSLATDTNYWCCLIFQSGDQKDAFLKNSGLEELGPRYLDGRLVAKKFGVSIPEQRVKFQGQKEDAAMTLHFDPIEPLPATLTAKKNGREARGSVPSQNLSSATMPKRVQIQFTGKGDQWHAAGDVAVLPDGRVEWTDNKLVTDGFVRESMYHPDEGRELRITEPEKYFDAWLHFGGNRNFRIVDMDAPASAADVLPQADWPRVSAKPESIQPFQEKVGIEEPMTGGEKASELAFGLSLRSEPDAETPKPNEEQEIDWDSGHLIEPDGCFLETFPDGTIVDFSAVPDVRPTKNAIAYQVLDATPSLGGWRTVSVWFINPHGGVDQTGPEGLVHHDFGLDVFGCEMLLEAMLKSKCDAHHRWVKVVVWSKGEPNQQRSQPPAK